VSIGLSSGFVAPLESTGLLFIQAGAETLADEVIAAAGGACDERHLGEFNAVMAGFMAESRDFVALHYDLTERDDNAFWRDVRDNGRKRLATTLRETADAMMNWAGDPKNCYVFEPPNWWYILLGMGYPEQALAGVYGDVNRSHAPQFKANELAQMRRFRAAIRAAGEKLARASEPHHAACASIGYPPELP
jgi:tryptophan halogenase